MFSRVHGFLRGACRPHIENLTSLSCLRNFQLCTKEVNPQCHSILNTSLTRMEIIRNASSQSIPNLSSRGRLSEAVVLYSNPTTKFLRMVNIFGYSFGAFWIYTSYQFSLMRITPAAHKRVSNLPWFARFDLVSSTTSKICAALLSSLLGFAVLGGAWIYSLRSVGKIVLERGGKTVTLTTYNPFTFAMNKEITANLSEISCQGHRTANSVVPIKVKDRWMHFLVSSEGSYHNAPLFDRTVGLRRSI